MRLLRLRIQHPLGTGGLPGFAARFVAGREDAEGAFKLPGFRNAGGAAVSGGGPAARQSEKCTDENRTSRAAEAPARA
ncbi:MAG: hypothetical protein BroJett003_09340 [Planctomycetota bacterium]|nr:MAG: hypothetical protein BroJett003_09340 [Planctomycetota bacterium]